MALSAPSPARSTNATLNITATDSASQTTTKAYSIPSTAAESSKSFSYDAMGNTLSDGDRIYPWDWRAYEF